jgi:hypothetical protein
VGNNSEGGATKSGTVISDHANSDLPGCAEIGLSGGSGAVTAMSGRAIGIAGLPGRNAATGSHPPDGGMASGASRSIARVPFQDGRGVAVAGEGGLRKGGVGGAESGTAVTHASGGRDSPAQAAVVPAIIKANASP